MQSTGKNPSRSRLSTHRHVSPLLISLILCMRMKIELIANTNQLEGKPMPIALC